MTRRLGFVASSRGTPRPHVAQKSHSHKPSQLGPVADAQSNRIKSSSNETGREGAHEDPIGLGRIEFVGCCDSGGRSTAVAGENGIPGGDGARSVLLHPCAAAARRGEEKHARSAGGTSQTT